MVGYLDEFWNAIAGATEGTVEWFQSLGNAVAGAIGNLLFYPLQAIVDFLLAVAYLLNQLYQIIVYLLAPFTYFFTWLYNFVLAIFTPADVDNLVENNAQVMAFFQQLPLFSVLLAVMTAGIWVLMISKTMHTLKH